jgi:hypothetical protein
MAETYRSVTNKNDTCNNIERLFIDFKREGNGSIQEFVPSRAVIHVYQSISAAPPVPARGGGSGGENRKQTFHLYFILP